MSPLLKLTQKSACSLYSWSSEAVQTTMYAFIEYPLRYPFMKYPHSIIRFRRFRVVCVNIFKSIGLRVRICVNGALWTTNYNRPMGMSLFP